MMFLSVFFLFLVRLGFFIGSALVIGGVTIYLFREKKEPRKDEASIPEERSQESIETDIIEQTSTTWRSSIRCFSSLNKN